MDNYYKENCAGLARRVEIFREEFVKKHGIPAIAHASMSPAFELRTFGKQYKVLAKSYLGFCKKKNQGCCNSNM